jgi:hypothetical protein
MLRLPGDANEDSLVDVSDLGILAAHYGTTTGAVWAMGDFNQDGRVDVSDLGILAANYGTGNELYIETAAEPLGLQVGEETSTAPCGLAAGLLVALGAAMLMLKEESWTTKNYKTVAFCFTTNRSIVTKR